MNLARGYGYTPEQVGRMTLAQAQALNDALFPEDERRGTRAGDAPPIRELKTAADYEAMFEAVRNGAEF
jgi:hypothetical protein